MQEIFIHKSEKVKGELKNIDQVMDIVKFNRFNLLRKKLKIVKIEDQII